MPSRIIREGILSSERINALKPLSELFYRRLMSVVDDFGRFSANPTLLRSSCYPLLIDDVKEVDITKHLAACVDVGLIVAYEVDHKKYLQMLDFRQQRRAEKSKYPEPPQQGSCDQMNTDAKQMISNVHLGVCVDVVEDVVDTSSLKDQKVEELNFDRFWKAYPRKVGKNDALKSWKKINPSKELVDKMIFTLAWQGSSKDWVKDDGKFIPHPSTWLNAGRWDDEPGIKTTTNGEW